MEQVIKNDMWLEHLAGFHKNLLKFKMKDKCSECYKEHNEIKQRSKFTSGQHDKLERLDFHLNREQR